MELFMHINELAQEGWGSLRTLALAAPRVILWGPSASYLAECRRTAPTLPSAEELLWYVEHGHLQLIARHWWLRNEDRRKNHPWEHARSWTSFDEAVLSMWQEDQRKGHTRTTARVIAADDEVGWDWARAEAQTGKIDIASLHNQATNLLPGYREKAARFENETDAALSLLRDAKNHGDAFLFSRADRNIGSPHDQKLAAVILECARAAGVADVPYIRADVNADALLTAVHSVLDRLRHGKGTSNSSDEIFERTRSLLDDKDELAKLREWISTCDMLAGRVREEDLAGEIAVRLMNAVQERSPQVRVSEYLLPKSPFQRIAVVAGIGLGVAGLIVGSPLAPISLSLLGLRPAEAIFKRLGWLPEDYTGDRWPFYVADGSGESRRTTREAILRALK